jgi:hypothetical protein
MIDATVERLQRYSSEFRLEDVELAAEIEEKQRGRTSTEFLANIGATAIHHLIPSGRKQLEILHIVPNGDYDNSKARVMHLGMGNDVGPNQEYQMATNFAWAPDTQLFAIGNPAGPGIKNGILSWADARRVYKGDLTPQLDPVFKFLSKRGVVETEQDGYSMGASHVFPSALRAEAFDQRVTHVTAVEVTDIKRRARGLPHVLAMLSLGVDFSKVGGPLADYAAANNNPAFEAANGGGSMLGYIIGLGRATNLANTSVLASDNFETKAIKAMANDEELTARVVTGTSSEISSLGLMQSITSSLKRQFPNRFEDIFLDKQYHTMVNDLALQGILFQPKQK